VKFCEIRGSGDPWWAASRLRSDADGAGVGGDAEALFASTGPGDDPLGIGDVGEGQDLDGGIAGAVTGTEMPFAGGTGAVAGDPSDPGADAEGISGGTIEGDAQAGFGKRVAEDARGTGVLGDHDVGSAIGIEVSHGGGAAFTGNPNPGFGGIDGGEIAVAIAAEDQAETGVVAGPAVVVGEEILGEQQVFSAIAIPVGDGDALDGRQLGGIGEAPDLPVIGVIEEDNGGVPTVGKTREGGAGGAEYFGEVTGGEGAMGFEAFAEQGDGGGENAEAVDGVEGLEGGIGTASGTLRSGGDGGWMITEEDIVGAVVVEIAMGDDEGLAEEFEVGVFAVVA